MVVNLLKTEEMRKIPHLSQKETSPVANSKSTGEKERKKRTGIVKSHDIKSIFKNAANKRKAPKENEDDSVVFLD